MNDLGLGLLDRRTVIVALFTIVIVNILFHFNLPIRTSSASELFVDLVLFTGYLYLARSLLRLPFALAFMLIGIISYRIESFTWSSRIIEMINKNNTGKLKIAAYKIVHALAYLVKMVFYVIADTVLFISSSANFEESLLQFESMSRYIYIKRIAYFIRFIDRAGLIAVVIFATLPKFTTVAKMLGVCGLLVMIFIYLLKGNFTLLLKDEIAEKQNETT